MWIEGRFIKTGEPLGQVSQISVVRRDCGMLIDLSGSFRGNNEVWGHWKRKGNKARRASKETRGDKYVKWGVKVRKNYNLIVCAAVVVIAVQGVCGVHACVYVCVDACVCGLGIIERLFLLLYLPR